MGPPVWKLALHRIDPKTTTRNIREFMGNDHRRCDELFAGMENAANAGDITLAHTYFAAFQVGMEYHFNMEEKGFFPTFERITGMRQGPTTVMRMEHEQMRGILKQMAQTFESKDLKALTRTLSTMLMVMQQHNIKEEQMLYPMGDMHIGGEADDMLHKMQSMY
ncbi:MAG: hemerythrin domain-containing protein [Magnetococcales bacterium]|nr:hemerythrin domain-containing protein [Magnetococcales bacterium]NGZ28515.1 hemerythrin domain-containing protein [Magnetococcales bacterium]